MGIKLSDRNIAGVFITEKSAICMVGELDRKKTQTYSEMIIPHTKNRAPAYVIPCDGKSPQVILEEAADYIRRNTDNLLAAHIACFGNFRLRQFGRLMTNTHYDDWNGTDVTAPFMDKLSSLPTNPTISCGTDVDAAAYGEYLVKLRKLKKDHKELKGIRNTLVYLNLSKSINGGIVRRGRIWSGEAAPMMSIIKTPRYTVRKEGGGTYFDLFEGISEFHRDSIEGMIGVAALERRTGIKFEDIPNDHFVWELVAFYVAHLCLNIVGILSPSHIILGGRIIKQTHDEAFATQLLKRIRGHFYSSISDGMGEMRPDYKEITDIENFITLPETVLRNEGGERRGLPGRHGALRLAALSALETELGVKSYARS